MSKEECTVESYDGSVLRGISIDPYSSIKPYIYTTTTTTESIEPKKWAPTFTSGGMITSGPLTTGAPTTRRRGKRLPLPPRISKKILLAFLEEDDDNDAYWAAKLKPEGVSIDFDEDGTPYMQLRLELVSIDEEEE